MTENQPFIHTFRTPGRHYIYDVNTNTILDAPKSAWSVLSENNPSISDIKESSNYIDALKSEGFLSTKRVEEIVHPADELIEAYLKNKVGMLTLQVTQQCNFRCDYCPYSGMYINRSHNTSRMDERISKKSIDFLISHSSDLERVALGFYGGEPLLELQLIKKSIAYLNKVGEGKDLYLTITTNGSLLTEEITDFLVENNFNIIISLDGPKSIHDKSRKLASKECGTFDIVMKNLERISLRHPDFLKKNVSINAVLDPNNDFECVNEFFTNYDIIKDLNLRANEISDGYLKKELPVNEEDFIVKRDYELFKIYLSKLGRLDEKHTSKIISEYFFQLKNDVHENLRSFASLPKKSHPGGPCIPGVERLFVSTNGTFFPCERVNENSHVMKIGHIDEGFYVDNIRNILNIGKITQDKCKNCWGFRFCTVCAASADDTDSFSPKMKRLKCPVKLRSIDQDFKDYCILKEFGYEF